MPGAGSVIDWLLDSDPSIRWQVMRDLLDAPESEWTAERAKVETGGTPQSREARKTAEEYLLARKLFRRLSTGEAADEDFLQFLHPNRWRYDVLRALDYFRAAAVLTSAAPDPRLEQAVDHVRSRRLEDGSWLLDASLPGRVWFEVDDGVGQSSRWVTLRSMRVLTWWEERHPARASQQPPARPSRGTSAQSRY
jgi:hypothetical protein